jgi:hypothetical protein
LSLPKTIPFARIWCLFINNICSLMANCTCKRSSNHYLNMVMGHPRVGHIFCGYWLHYCHMYSRSQYWRIVSTRFLCLFSLPTHWTKPYAQQFVHYHDLLLKLHKSNMHE